MSAMNKAGASGNFGNGQYVANKSSCTEDQVAHVDIFGRIRSESECEAIHGFNQWRKKYEQVENVIYEARAKRETSKKLREEARKKEFGNLCELTEGRAVLCNRWNMSLEEVEMFILGKESSGFWKFPEMFLWRAKKVQEEATIQVSRLSHLGKRPFYYEREKARRQAIAEERRKVKRRHTLNACPTKEAILNAWIHVKDSNEALLHFGSLLQDLECYVDNDLRRNEGGVIIGRNHGIKGWLQMELPALYLRYKTVMAYKAMAKKMRQLVELNDPIPLDAVLDVEGKDGDISERRKAGTKDGGDSKVDNVPVGDKKYHNEYVRIERARNLYREIMETMTAACRENLSEKGIVTVKRCNRIAKGRCAGIGRIGDVAYLRCSAAGLSRLIDAFIKPEYVEEATVPASRRLKYANEIMVRSNSRDKLGCCM